MRITSFGNIARGVGAVLLCEAAGILGSLFTAPKIGTWYQSLVLPSFAPPSWIFAPVWITLYFLMGVALFIVLMRGEEGTPITRPVAVFGVQLFLNVLWSYLFFGLESPLSGLVGIIALWLAIIFTIREFHRVDRLTLYLLVPYLVWVSVAGILNYSIMILNP
ncbi:MAG: tryptophan-rich sensory protein [Methanomicrobiales archaeon]|nr:tryptophan-rich sensory protein [Methanomicrobiales archaeon]